jgi:hypothetical protein
MLRLRGTRSAVRIVFNHVHYLDTRGSGLFRTGDYSDTADTAIVSQYASTWDPRLIASGDKEHKGTPRPKRIVSA